MREMLQDIVEKRFLSINESGKEGWKIPLLVLKREFLEQAGGPMCLGTQFKWKIFLRFCVRFLTINESMLICCEKDWHNGARGFRAVSVGSAAGREWAPPHARRSLAVAGRGGTARLNIKPAFRTPGNHAASSVISLSSFSFAAFAQPCRFGIAVAFHETGKSLVAGGYEIYNLALCLVLFSTFSCQRLTSRRSASQEQEMKLLLKVGNLARGGARRILSSLCLISSIINLSAICAWAKGGRDARSKRYNDEKGG